MPSKFTQSTTPASGAKDSEVRESQQQSSVVRTRQGRYEAPIPRTSVNEPTQRQLISARRKSFTLPALAIPQQSGEPLSPSIACKSPGYLQGKNPYGQVLERVDHPYRDPRPATSGVQPIQTGSSYESPSSPSETLAPQSQPRADEPSELSVRQILGHQHCL